MGVKTNENENFHEIDIFMLIADELKVDDGQAVATVQIRLHDGKTMKVKLNHYLKELIFHVIFRIALQALIF